MQSSSHPGNILIIGGTSGLGLELVKIYLTKGFNVVATGRQPLELTGYDGRFKFLKLDFRDLDQSAIEIRKICDNLSFDLVVNNAGILSPPGFELTQDGFELTFQVNFLAHLLLNEIIVNRHTGRIPLKIVAVTSPVYKLRGLSLSSANEKAHYRPYKSYSESKLFLTLMCSHLSKKYQDKELLCISFNPGTFRSGISRTRGSVFKFLYKIAAPFMRNPEKVAKVLYDILEGEILYNGEVYNMRKHAERLPDYKYSGSEVFWKECYEKIAHYLE